MKTTLIIKCYEDRTVYRPGKWSRRPLVLETLGLAMPEKESFLELVRDRGIDEIILADHAFGMIGCHYRHSDYGTYPDYKGILTGHPWRKRLIQNKMYFMHYLHPMAVVHELQLLLERVEWNVNLTYLTVNQKDRLPTIIWTRHQGEVHNFPLLEYEAYLRSITEPTPEGVKSYHLPYHTSELVKNLREDAVTFQKAVELKLIQDLPPHGKINHLVLNTTPYRWQSLWINPMPGLPAEIYCLSFMLDEANLESSLIQFDEIWHTRCSRDTVLYLAAENQPDLERLWQVLYHNFRLRVATLNPYHQIQVVRPASKFDPLEHPILEPRWKALGLR